MKSKAAIGNHPIHPMLVPVPIGAFVLSLIGDLLHTARPEDPYWYVFSYSCMGLGILFGIFAAIAGAVDYLTVRMSAAGFRTATRHAIVNLAMMAAYCVSFALRRNDAALAPERWPAALAVSLAGFGLLCISGWLGGKLAYEHRVGVIDPPEAAAPRHPRQETRGVVTGRPGRGLDVAGPLRNHTEGENRPSFSSPRVSAVRGGASGFFSSPVSGTGGRRRPAPETP